MAWMFEILGLLRVHVIRVGIVGIGERVEIGRQHIQVIVLLAVPEKGNVTAWKTLDGSFGVFLSRNTVEQIRI